MGRCRDGQEPYPQGLLRCRVDARYIPLRDLIDFAPEQVLADAEVARLVAIDDIDCVESRAGWQEALFALLTFTRNGCAASGDGGQGTSAIAKGIT